MLPTAPQFITASQPNPEVAQFVFTWNEVPGGGYNLYRDGVIIQANHPGFETSDTDIEWNRQYIYRISATDGEIESALSVPVMLTATPVGIPFATAEELAVYWRTLTESEIARATALILIASNRLRGYATGQTPDLDARFNASATYRSVVSWVVLEAVKRAMQAPSDLPPVESYQQTAGPYSENYKYTNPTGDLWFKKAELQALGLSGNQKLSSINLTTAREIYPLDNEV